MVRPWDVPGPEDDGVLPWDGPALVAGFLDFTSDSHLSRKASSSDLSSGEDSFMVAVECAAAWTDYEAMESGYRGINFLTCK